MPNRRCTSQATGANDTTSVCCHSTSPAPHTVTRGRYTLHTDVTSPPLSSARSKKIHKKNKSHVVPRTQMMRPLSSWEAPQEVLLENDPLLRLERLRRRIARSTSNLKHVCSQLRHDRRLRCLCLRRHAARVHRCIIAHVAFFSHELQQLFTDGADQAWQCVYAVAAATASIASLATGR